MLDLIASASHHCGLISLALQIGPQLLLPQNLDAMEISPILVVGMLCESLLCNVQARHNPGARSVYKLYCATHSPAQAEADQAAAIAVALRNGQV